MTTLSIILISIVALLHFYFLILEMFLWTKPKTMKAFGIKDKSFAEETKVLAANQGLYNGFLSAGLVFSIITKDSIFGIFFLVCIIIAGIYGAYSTKKIKLFYVQAVPAIIALTNVFFKII